MAHQQEDPQDARFRHAPALLLCRRCFYLPLLEVIQIIDGRCGLGPGYTRNGGFAQSCLADAAYVCAPAEAADPVPLTPLPRAGVIGTYGCGAAARSSHPRPRHRPRATLIQGSMDAAGGRTLLA